MALSLVGGGHAGTGSSGGAERSKDIEATRNAFVSQSIPEHSDAKVVRPMVPTTDGDPNAPPTAVRVAEACWQEPGSPGAVLADVLGIPNLAPTYVAARALFVEVLLVRRKFAVDELCRGLDVLSDAFMDRAYPFDEPQRAFAASMLVESPDASDRTAAVCTYVYEALASAELESSDYPAYQGLDALQTLDADFFERRRIFIPSIEVDEQSAYGQQQRELLRPYSGVARFSTSEDVYWAAGSSDEEALALACGLHALGTHYPSSLRRFFTSRLHVPQRPEPSTSRLLEALLRLTSAAQSDATTRVVNECQKRLAELDLQGLEGNLGINVADTRDGGCPHGPGCTHPACLALSQLYAGSNGNGAGGNGQGGTSGTSGNRLVKGGTDAAASKMDARRAVEQTMHGCKRSQAVDFRRPKSLLGQETACQECEHPCDANDFDLRLAFATTHGVPVYVDKSVPLQALSGMGATFGQVPQMAEAFGSLLTYLGGLLGPAVPPSMHIFFEPPLTPTGMPRREVYAFNADGHLFFSLRAFFSLHASLESIWLPEVTTCWACTLAHELAHNTEKGHGAGHEVLMEAVMEELLPRLVASHVAAATGGAGTAAPPSAGGVRRRR